MLKKFVDKLQGKKSRHPLGSKENVDALMASLSTGDPAHLLIDVDEWLSGMETHITKVGALGAIAACLQLDLISRPAANQFLENFLTPQRREYQSETTWLALDTHAMHLQNACRICLTSPPAKDETPSDRNKRVRLLAVGLRSWSLRKKLLRFRYRSPDGAFWHDGHELLRLVSAKLHHERCLILREDSDTTPLHEYLVGLYFEFVPVGNLRPDQLEVIDRFIRSQMLEFTTQANASTNHHIDLAAAIGPQRHVESAVQGGSGMRYCTTVRLRSEAMQQATTIKKTRQQAEWLAGLPIDAADVTSALLLLAMYWAPTPPQREHARSHDGSSLHVMFGYNLARRMVACSHFAREGISLEYESANFNSIFEEQRFGGQVNGHEVPVTELEQPTEPVDPLDTLRRLELAGDKAQMETWRQIDESARGVGASPPRLLVRHRVGGLIAFRDEEELDWRLAIIRRIGRATVDGRAGRPSIGLETLPWPSLCALARQTDRGFGTGEGNIWGDAVLMAYDKTQIMLPADSFVSGRELDVRSHEGLWRIRMSALIESGADFDLIEFQRIS